MDSEMDAMDMGEFGDGDSIILEGQSQGKYETSMN